MALNSYQGVLEQWGQFMEEKNGKEKAQFQFLHEEVLDSKRRKIQVRHVIFLVTICAVVFGTVACLMFFGLIPTMQDLFHTKEGDEVQAGTTPTRETGLADLLGENETIAGTSLDEIVEDALKDYKKDDKDSEDYHAVQEQLGTIGENIEPAMVTLVSYKCDDWFSQEEKDKTVTSGIILEASCERGITVLTNQNALVENKKLVAYLSNEKGYPAEIIQESSMIGIALVHIDGSMVSQELIDSLKVVKVDAFSDIQTTAAEAVVLLGNPYSTNRYMAYGSLVTVSDVIDKTDVRYELMTTNIKDGGSMNGFLLNLEGQVLGMVIQEHKSDKMKQIVTATNLSALQVYIQRMLDRKNVSYIGINGQEITEEIVQKVDKNMPRGIYITNIDDQSPAFHAGLMRGDILVALETSEIQTVEGYVDILQQYDVGTVVKITVMRKGKDGYKPIIYDVEIGSH